VQAHSRTVRNPGKDPRGALPCGSARQAVYAVFQSKHEQGTQKPTNMHNGQRLM